MVATPEKARPPLPDGHPATSRTRALRKFRRTARQPFPEVFRIEHVVDPGWQGAARNPVPTEGEARTGREVRRAQPARAPLEARGVRAALHGGPGCQFHTTPASGRSAWRRAGSSSGCFRTRLHAEALCRISSYLSSTAALGYNPLIAIQIALAGNAADMLRLHYSQSDPRKG